MLIVLAYWWILWNWANSLLVAFKQINVIRLIILFLFLDPRQPGLFYNWNLPHVSLLYLKVTTKNAFLIEFFLISIVSLTVGAEDAYEASTIIHRGIGKFGEHSRKLELLEAIACIKQLLRFGLAVQTSLLHRISWYDTLKHKSRNC